VVVVAVAAPKVGGASESATIAKRTTTTMKMTTAIMRMGEWLAMAASGAQAPGGRWVVGRLMMDLIMTVVECGYH
jgi:hypothetical protein